MGDERHLIEVVEYDANWPDEFERERDLLGPSLAPWAAGAVEHVGSTAVPGMSAKPVIDIMVPVHSLEASRPAIAILEANHGYSHWPYKATVMHWFCKPSEFVRTHHLYLIPVDSDLFGERLLFRDALRRDAELRDRYAVLKRDLAARFSRDREAYTQGKGRFVAEVVSRMRARSGGA